MPSPPRNPIMLEGAEQDHAVSGRRTSGLTHSRFLAAFQSPDERMALEAVSLPPRTLPANTDLVREGDATDRLYVLTEGWACRYKTARDGSRQIVALLVPGDVANLDTLMFGRPDFGVRVLTAAKVVALPCEDVLALAGHHAGIGSVLARLSMIENAILSQWALCLGRMSAQKRLAHLLCELGERLHPDQAADGMRFDLPLTQEQLADALGLTSVHVNRTLQQLRGDALVETGSRTIGFPDVSRLRNVAEFDAAYLHAGSADGLRPWPAMA